MALFAGSLHKIIDDQADVILGLRFELAAQEAAHMDSVQYLTGMLAQAQEAEVRARGQHINAKAAFTEAANLTASHHAAEVARLVEQARTKGQLASVEIARRDGIIEGGRSEVRILGLIREQHEWVREGQRWSHGLLMDVWKCASELKDADTMRVLLPAGTVWLANQEREPIAAQEEITASTERIDWRTPAAS